LPPQIVLSRQETEIRVPSVDEEAIESDDSV